MKSSMRWDIFCKVIDNYGDIGVCWRLSADLASRGERVRLWVDDASALAWMAPEGCLGVEVMAWTEPFTSHDAVPGDVLVEAFGCEIPPEFIADYIYSTRARGSNHSWINLEYLSAEPYAQRSHGLPSPVLSGAGQGLTKHFFYPGFTPNSGGLLHESDLLVRQAAFDRNRWLTEMGIPFEGERLISLFCYEPPTLQDLLNQLATEPRPTRLLVTSGRAKNAVFDQIINKSSFLLPDGIKSSLSISHLPQLTQRQFDGLLWACDLNFVRGEDSLVRAIWAGKPFIWHIYPQHDNAHHAKLHAFLDVMDMPDEQRQFHRTWNGLDNAPLPEIDVESWQAAATLARDRLQTQTSLTDRLMEFVAKTR
jgi:uncharacterized repeat protein (TIGR03837 family)